jgi:hypothetical protein
LFLHVVSLRKHQRGQNKTMAEVRGEGPQGTDGVPTGKDEMQSVAWVFARGKARQDGKKQRVSVTLELLQDLGRHPLHMAADKLGISATALKGACRKLGISRWPYFAGRGLVPVYLKQTAPKAPSALQDAATQTDVSFGGVYGCEVPALVEDEAEFDMLEDAVSVWY